MIISECMGSGLLVLLTLNCLNSIQFYEGTDYGCANGGWGSSR